MERLLDYFEPINYNLKLDINKKTNSITGQVQITGYPKSSIIKLHAVDMEIKSANIVGANVGLVIEDNAKNRLFEIMPRNPHEDFKASEPCDGGRERARLEEVRLDIDYSAHLNENMEGAYLSTYRYKGKTEKIVTTQFESHYAREAFPCIDEPAAKATFDIAIKTDDEEDLILSNMPKKSEAEGYTIFETTPRMSTYLVAFIAGKFHGKTVTNAHGIKITTYAPLNQPLESVDFANEVAAKSLEFYDNEFGIPYPLEKCDQVALPDFEAGAMENWGLVTYRESMLLASSSATADTKKSVALTVAHELSHQWFGDLVTMKWWDDLWLNESFASIMEYMAIDHLYPDFHIWEDFFTGDCIAALRRDSLTGVQSVHQPVENPDEIATLFDGAIVYAKGARLMLMLIRQMGWDNFKKGIKDYFEKYAYQNTIGDNLWDALKPYADFDPKTFMHAWIENPNYPVITDGKQFKFRLDGPLEPSDWPIPHITTDMAGHYVINYQEADFAEKLAHFNALGLEEKLRLLIDRDLIAKTPLAPSASLLDLIAKFKDENSAAIWEIIASIIGSLKIFFTPDSKEEKAFKNFIGELVSLKLSQIGIQGTQKDDNNIIRLRNILLALDFYAETRANLEQLAMFYDDNLSKIAPELRSHVLDAKIYCSPQIFDIFLEKYQTIADPDIKSDLFVAMTLSKDAANVDKLISLLGRPDIIKPQDHLHLYIYLYRNPKTRAKTFSWLTENWDYVQNLSGGKTIEDYPRYTANSIKTETEADAFWAFFEDKKSIPVLARTLKMAETEIATRLQLIATDQVAIYRKLS